MPDTQRITNIVLDGRTIVSRIPQVEHERRAAIYDILEENTFVPKGDFKGPYTLHIGIEENRLAFGVHDQQDAQLTRFTLALSSFRSMVREYLMMCDSYYKAIKSATPSQIETIDMGRRGLHNQGADLLRERLNGKADVDYNTARRLFTLICVLHIRG